MTFVALRMLMGDRLKYFGLIAGVAFAAMLITQQASILVGLAHQTGAFIRDTSQGDLWVMDEQVRFSQDTLALQDTALSRVRSVRGVEWAMPLYQGFLRARLPDGTRMTIILVGIDDATLMGGPPEMIEGSLADLRQDKAVLVDAKAAVKKMIMRKGGGRGVGVGDALSINDNEVRIVGTYRASPSFFWEPVIYTTYSRALAIAPPERRMTAYVVAKVRAGQDPQEVAWRIKDATGLAARTSEEFVKVTTDYILKETGILVNFGLAVGLGFVIGTLVAAQMLYNFTVDNLRHYGAIKAMGATNLVITGMVLAQALTVAVLGYGLGIGVGAVLGKVVEMGGLAFRMPWQIPVFGAVAIILICMLAGALSLARVLRLEPAVVFKA